VFRLYWLSLSSVAVASASQSVRNDSSLVKLEVRTTLSIPSGQRIVGIATESSERVLLWGPTNLWLLGAGRKPQQICERESKLNIVGAFFLSHGEIGVLDAQSRRVLRWQGVGTCAPWFRVPAGDARLLGILSKNCALIVLSRGPSGDLFLSTVDTMGKVGRTVRVPLLSPSIPREASDWAYLTAWAGGVVVGTHRLPGWWIAFDQDLKEISHSLGISSRLLEISGVASRPVHLYLGPIVRIGQLFLQTMTDLTSRRRATVVYDSRGRMLRVTNRNSGMSLVVSMPGDSLIVGIQRELAVMAIYARAP